MTIDLRRALWICAMAGVTSTGIVAAPGAALRGTVGDTLGAAISDAFIIVHDDVSGSGRLRNQTRPDITVRPDARGRFSTQLESGFYDVCVLATAFTPDCRKVLLKQNQAIDLKIRLKVDPLIVKELGDHFSRK